MLHFSSPDELLQHVDSLSHHRRCATLVEFGRCSITATDQESSALQSIITSLGAPSQGYYHHLLAAFALRGAFAETRRVGRAMPAALLATASSLLEDSSLKVSQLLMTPMCILAPNGDRQTAAMTIKFLQRARFPQFKCLVKRLVRAKRTQSLLQLYQAHTVTDPAKMQLLLGSLSLEELEKLPKEEQYALDTESLRLLCRYHPQRVTQYLTARVQEQVNLSKAVDAALQELIQKALVFLATHGASKDGLSLFTATAHLLSLERCTVHTMLEHYYLSVFPVEIGRYLLDGEGREMVAAFSYPLNCTMPRRAWRRLERHTDLLLRLLDRGILCTVTICLPSMLPGARRAYFARGCRELEDTRGVLEVRWIACMPSAAERRAFAHRFYNHAKLQDFPDERIDYLSLLPFPEAMRIGEAYVTSNDAEIRCQMIRAGLASLQYYPEHLPAALEFCAKRPKEQDPWRRAMLEAWAALPLGFWRRTVTHIADGPLQNMLTQLIQATYSARDVSDQTLQGLEKLLCRLVGPQTNFAVSQLVTLIRKRKQFTIWMSPSHAFRHLPQLYPHALPVLAAALLPLAQMLIRSGSMWTSIHILQSLLESEAVAKALLRETSAPSNGEPSIWSIAHDTLRAGMSSTDDGVANVSLDLYSRHFAPQLSVELSDLIAEQKDWVTVSKVQHLVCDTLQGPLLDTLVTPIENIPTGRFHHTDSNSLALVCQLPVEKAHRWTSRQQIRYAQSCLQAMYTPLELDFCQYNKFIANLARLPAVSAATSWTDADGNTRSLITLATEVHPEHGSYAMRLALQALGQLDGDAAAQKALQNALDVADLRADALRALATTLRRVPSAEAVRILEPVLKENQVTVLKEALRLLGAKRDDVAYARIVQFAAERHLPMPSEVTGDCGGVAAPSAVATSTPPAALREETAMAMHGDVLAALVAALFSFLDKPQVWSYYTFIVTQDCVAAQRAVGAEVPAATKGEESGDYAEEANTAATSSGDKQETTPSLAACSAMSNVQWKWLRLPWQVREYQALLQRLLHHPVRDVGIAALHTLASVPPYDNLAMCKAASKYLGKFTSPHIAQSALRCMLTCTAAEAAPFIISVILSIQSDASLERVVNVLGGIMLSAAAHERRLLCTVVTGVVEKLIAARRQPTIVVSLICKLDLSEWVPRLVEMETAGLMHPGAAAALIGSVQGYSYASHNTSAMEVLEQTVLKRHPSALLRRLGLAMLLETCKKRGWSEDRKLSLAAYCEDSNLWVSSDARLAQSD
ncbi:hypothetical protein Q4I32_006350 [Leishmania shawi]|uniref:ARM-like helical domain-containing protein n=1 Tax=Leishmania shawi TaxID=5680 RepID=A0AAW3BEH3_9TRYP